MSNMDTPTSTSTSTSTIGSSSISTSTGSASMMSTPSNSVAGTEVRVIPYSEKSCVVIGDTYKIKDLLKTAGGRWNRQLKQHGLDKGWIFPIDQMHRVQQLINNFSMGTENSSGMTESITSQTNTPVIRFNLPRPTVYKPVKTSSETTRDSFEEEGAQVELEKTTNVQIIVRNGQEIKTIVTTTTRTETRPIPVKE